MPQLANEKLREPAALPGWLATTTQRECLRVLRARGRYDVFGTAPDDGGMPAQADAMVIEENLDDGTLLAALRAAVEARAAVPAAFVEAGRNAYPAVVVTT